MVSSAGKTSTQVFWFFGLCFFQESTVQEWNKSHRDTVKKSQDPRSAALFQRVWFRTVLWPSSEYNKYLWTGHTLSSTCLNIWIRDSTWFLWPSCQGSFDLRYNIKTVVVSLNAGTGTEKIRNWGYCALPGHMWPVICEISFYPPHAQVLAYTFHICPCIVVHLNSTSQSLSSSAHQWLPTIVLGSDSRDRIW